MVVWAAIALWGAVYAWGISSFHVEQRREVVEFLRTWDVSQRQLQSFTYPNTLRSRIGDPPLDVQSYAGMWDHPENVSRIAAQSNGESFKHPILVHVKIWS